MNVKASEFSELRLLYAIESFPSWISIDASEKTFTMLLNYRKKAEA